MPRSIKIKQLRGAAIYNVLRVAAFTDMTPDFDVSVDTAAAPLKDKDDMLARAPEKTGAATISAPGGTADAVADGTFELLADDVLFGLIASAGLL